MKNARKSHIDKVCACVSTASHFRCTVQGGRCTHSKPFEKGSTSEENEIAKHRLRFIQMQQFSRYLSSLVPDTVLLWLLCIYILSTCGIELDRVGRKKATEKEILIIKEFLRLQSVWIHQTIAPVSHFADENMWKCYVFFALMPRITTTATTNDIEFSRSLLLSNSLLHWFDVGWFCSCCCSIVLTSVFNLPVSRYVCKNNMYFCFFFSFSHWLSRSRSLSPSFWLLHFLIGYCSMAMACHIVSMNRTDELHAQNTQWQLFIASNQPFAVCRGPKEIMSFHREWTSSISLEAQIVTFQQRQ